MQHLTSRPNPAAAPAGPITFSAAARTAIVVACRRGQRQAVLLSWPGGATYLPREYYQPGEFDAIVGHIAGCPVFVDVRRRALFRNERMLLDAAAPTRTQPHPPLRTRAVPTSPEPADRPTSDAPGSLEVAARRPADDVVAAVTNRTER